MADANKDQIEFWAGAQGQKWLRLQDGIDRMMQPYLDAGFEALGTIDGSHCLDVGCGTGASSLALADRAGPAGSVTGIDVSTPMLGKARERAADRSNMTFVEADAQDYAFETTSFDVLFSRFGIMFFQDPAAAFANLRGACKPGARMAAITWQEPRENPWVMIPVATAKDFVELPPRPAPEAPGQFQWADPDRARGWLEAAGWSEISIDPLDVMLTFPAEPQEVAYYLLQMGPAAALIAEAGGDLKERAEARLAENLAPHYEDGAVRLGSACWTVTATA